MTKNQKKLLSRARRSPSGWKRDELISLYTAFGFTVKEANKHTIVSHPNHPKKRGVITRSNELATGYVRHAVKLIEEISNIENNKNS